MKRPVARLTLGVITDLHFGPQASFGGHLRKLSSQAEALTRAFSLHMREHVQPDLVVNLGDVVEDESPLADRARYRQCMRLLAESGCEVVSVAGNHDRVNLDAVSLRSMWGMPPAGPLYRSFDRGGVHLVVLYTHERKDRDVTLDEHQLQWLQADLRATSLPTLVLMHHSAADQDVRKNRWFANAPQLCLIKQRKRLRCMLARHRHTLLVLNGHLHWNHLDVIDGIPYLTLQSLIENIDEGAPGRAAAAHAVVRVRGRLCNVEVAGHHPAHYQFHTRGAP